MSNEKCPHCGLDLEDYCQHNYGGELSWEDECPTCQNPISVEAADYKISFSIEKIRQCREHGCEELEYRGLGLCRAHYIEDRDREIAKMEKERKRKGEGKS